jgi:hypothetical protein
MVTANLQVHRQDLGAGCDGKCQPGSATNISRPLQSNQPAIAAMENALLDIEA